MCVTHFAAGILDRLIRRVNTSGRSYYLVMRKSPIAVTSLGKELSIVYALETLALL